MRLFSQYDVPLSFVLGVDPSFGMQVMSSPIARVVSPGPRWEKDDSMPAVFVDPTTIKGKLLSANTAGTELISGVLTPSFPDETITGTSRSKRSWMRALSLR